jgi:hypothetical protein
VELPRPRPSRAPVRPERGYDKAGAGVTGRLSRTSGPRGRQFQESVWHRRAPRPLAGDGPPGRSETTTRVGAGGFLF